MYTNDGYRHLSHQRFSHYYHHFLSSSSHHYYCYYDGGSPLTAPRQRSPVARPRSADVRRSVATSPAVVGKVRLSQVAAATRPGTEPAAPALPRCLPACAMIYNLSTAAHTRCLSPACGIRDTEPTVPRWNASTATTEGRRQRLRMIESQTNSNVRIVIIIILCSCRTALSRYSA